MLMQESNRIPRWLVESDPSWEKSVDSDLGMLKWTKKGTGVRATCPPTGMFCEITGQDDVQAGLADVRTGIARMGKKANMADDIAKYLPSRYLNPSFSGPSRPDLRKLLKF